MEASRDGRSLFSGFARPGDRRGRCGRDEPSGCGGAVWGQRVPSAIKWVERFERTGFAHGGANGRLQAPEVGAASRVPGGLRAEKPDITLQALCDRLLAERGVTADTSLMSRFLRRLGVTLKKRRSSRASRIART